jgi:3-dehydroquinate dehydratase/shikimate dehydrogenase
MSLLCCPLHVDAVDQIDEALAQARAAAARGARLIEWRVDLLAEESIDVAARAIRALVERAPVPCIVTIRPTWEGGLYGGSETDRISLFEAVGTSDAAPRYLDLELDAYRTSRNRRQKVNLAVDHAAQVRDVGPRLILSTHDFKERPADLVQRVAAMASEDACAVLKLAWTARSLRDNIEAFELLRDRPKPMVALCMGEFGLASRVLAPKFGGLFTFAALERGAESAPGQPTLEEMRSLYRFDAINRATKVYGVVGWPVAHSKSPAFHNARFAERGHDGVYLPLPVPPAWEHFKASIGAFVDFEPLDFAGASVTIPHKEHCIRFVAERGGAIGGLARLVGAANTLVVDRARSLSCANTDAPAALLPLARAFERTDGRLDGLRIAVLGAGGAARAIAGGVALAGGIAVVLHRERAKAEALAAELAGRLEGFDPSSLDPCERFLEGSGPLGRVVAGNADSLSCGCYHGFVNCTPLGMQGGPGPDENPLESLAESAGASFAHEVLGDAVVMDTVYAPEWTPMLREARDRGARCVLGSSMFDEQALRQSARWLGDV